MTRPPADPTVAGRPRPNLEWRCWVLEDSSSGVTLKHGRCRRGRTSCHRVAGFTSVHQRYERCVRTEPAGRFQSDLFLVTGEAEECDVGAVSREEWQRHKVTLCVGQTTKAKSLKSLECFSRQWIAALFISVGILLLLGNNGRNSWSREEFIRMWTCWKGSQDRDQLLV